jgi:hypothetical protein
MNKASTFQDANLLEHNLLLWPLSKVSALSALCQGPDLVVRLGIGEPRPSNYDTSTSERQSVQENNSVCRLRTFC